MSLITTAEAAPSRLLGLFRYVASRSLTEEQAEEAVWPKGVRSSEGKFGPEVRREMLELGLVELREGNLLPHPQVPSSAVKTSDHQVDEIALAIALLVMGSSERNHDLAAAIAWFLGLDPLSATGTKGSVLSQISEAGLKDSTRVTSDVTYGQFEDWCRFLGFSWKMPSIGSASEERFIPDPTAFLRRFLPALLPEVGVEVRLREFCENLASEAGVFEGGVHRKRVESAIGLSRPPNHLSRSTSLALERLSAEGVIEMSAHSDAEVHVLEYGNTRVSHISRLE